jgi:hypothetical protein
MRVFNESRRQELIEAAGGDLESKQKTLDALRKVKGGEKIIVFKQPFTVVKAIEGPKRREIVLKGAKKQALLFLPDDAGHTAILQKGSRNEEVSLSKISVEGGLSEASGSVNKYDVRRAEEEWEDADAMAKSYEEDDDKRAPEARKKADELKKALEDLKARWEKQKAKCRESGRARSGAYSSLGMKRSRYGGWE